jgi:hypothetical protein
MVQLRPDLHNAPPLDRVQDHPVAEQSLLEHLDLQLQEPDMGIATRRPRLVKQHQQRRQPLWEHRSGLHRNLRKSSNGNSPTFWTTSPGVQQPVAWPPRRAQQLTRGSLTLFLDFRVHTLSF